MEMKYVPTTCPYCGTGCGFNLVVKDGKVVGVQPWHRNPVNEGKLCPKGNYAWEFINAEDRLTTPLIKKDGKFVEASWDEALDLVASEVQAVPGRAECGALFGPCLERRELPDAEVRARGHEDAEHRPLRPPLPRLDGRRPRRRLRLRRDDPVDQGHRRRGRPLHHRDQHTRAAPPDWPADHAGQDEGREDHRGRPAPHADGEARRHLPALRFGHGRRAAQLLHAVHHRERPAGQGVRREADQGLRQGQGGRDEARVLASRTSRRSRASLRRTSRPPPTSSRAPSPRTSSTRWASPSTRPASTTSSRSRTSRC